MLGAIKVKCMENVSQDFVIICQVLMVVFCILVFNELMKSHN